MLDILERQVVVAGKDDQAEGDMRTVGELADRLELVPVLVMALLVSPMMLFLKIFIGLIAYNMLHIIVLQIICSIFDNTYLVLWSI